MTCQILRSLMVAVVFATGSLGSALACTETRAFEAESHAAQEHVRDAHHVHDSHGDGRVSVHAFDVGAIHAGHGAEHHHEHREGPSGPTGCDGCPHVHAHCCATTAMPVGDCGLRPALALGVPAPEAGAPLPLGQLFYPLLRPPSAAA